MQLDMLGDIYFKDIIRRVQVGIPRGVSRELLFVAKEACTTARRDVCFADIRDNPDYSEYSRLTAVDAMCYPCEQVPFVFIFVRFENCDETMALHELMHIYLYFAEGYRTPRPFRDPLPFHVKLFAGLIGNIAMDLHTNERLRQRGFVIDSLREECFRALSDSLPLLARPSYAGDAAFQWQIGAMWGHMLAGEHFYRVTDDNLRLLRRLEKLCASRSSGTMRFQGILIDTCRAEGYDTPHNVGRILDKIAPELFGALGDIFDAEQLVSNDQAFVGTPVSSIPVLNYNGVQL